MIPRLRQDIEDIAKRIKERCFESEAQVSQGVVQRLLASLGWPRYETQIVIPEFAVGGGRRVDYALCHPPKKAVVLVEVKKPGAVNPRAEEQLFGYCVRVGVPIAVLTDGQTWHFFLPAGLGSFEERRFARVDLTSDDPIKAEEQLLRYLQYMEVKEGRSPEHAQQDLTRMRQERAYKQAWQSIVERPARRFLQLFVQEVKNVAALDPSEDEAAAWLRRRAAAERIEPPPPPVEPPNGSDPRPEPAPDPPPKRGDYVIWSGERKDFSKQQDAMQYAFKVLQAENPGFCRRFSKRHRGHKKLWVVDRKGLPTAEFRVPREVGDGWHVETSLSADQKVDRIKKACVVADVSYGHGKKMFVRIGGHS